MSSVHWKILARMAILVLLALGGAAPQASQGDSSHRERRLPKGSLPQSYALRNLQGVQVTRFALINADSNSEITTVNLDSSTTIAVNSLPSLNLSIVAIVTGTGISKVVFEFNLNGVTGSKTENNAPYALCGGKGSPPDYNACKSLGLGRHTITAKAFVSTSIAASKTVSFERKSNAAIISNQNTEYNSFLSPFPCATFQW